MGMEKSFPSLSKYSNVKIREHFFFGGEGIIDNKIIFASRPKRCFSFFSFKSLQVLSCDSWVQIPKQDP